jgi:rod shape-determining protein MreC
MVLDHRYHATNFIRSTLSVVVDPLRYLVNLPFDITDWASQSFVSRSTLQEENQTLRTKNELLNARLQKYASLKAENANLRSLLKSVEKNEESFEQVLVAEILAVDLDPFRKQIVINKGTDANVYIGQPLIGAQGVIGKVVHVGHMTSTAMLITDPSHSLPVQNNRNGVRGVAVGNPKKNQLSLIHQPTNTDIKEGDLLVTSGLGCFFPPGYPAGKVTNINTNPSLPFAEIIVEPTAQLDRNREVLLIWPSHYQMAQEHGECVTPGNKEKKQ